MPVHHTYSFVASREIEKDDFVSMTLSDCKQYIFINSLYCQSIVRFTDFIQAVKQCHQNKTLFSLSTLPNIELDLDAFIIGVKFNNEQMTFVAEGKLYHFRFDKPLSEWFDLLKNTEPKFNLTQSVFVIPETNTHTVLKVLVKEFSHSVKLCLPNNPKHHVFIKIHSYIDGDISAIYTNNIVFHNITPNNVRCCAIEHLNDKTLLYVKNSNGDILVYKLIDFKQLIYHETIKLEEYQYVLFNSWKTSEKFSLSKSNLKDKLNKNPDRKHNFNHHFYEMLSDYMETTINPNTTIVLATLELNNNTALPDFLKTIVAENKELLDKNSILAIFEIIKT